MAESLFGGVISTLQQMGFFDVLLPFLLIFAIVYGILEKVKLFEDRADINAVIAFVIGMIVIGTSWVIGVLTGFLPWVGMLTVVFLAAVILMGFFWKDIDAIGDTPVKYIAAIVILVVFAAVLLPMVLPPEFWSSFQGAAGESAFSIVDIGALVAILIVFFAIFYVAKSSSGTKTKGS